MPVPNYEKAKIREIKYGKFTFESPRFETLQRLAGSMMINEERANQVTRQPLVNNPSLTAFRGWTQSIAPFGEHNNCLPSHHLVTMPIPMIETQFLRRKCPNFPPEAVIGQIAVSLCLKRGTRLRIDILDQQQDIELDVMTNLYTILTGPVENGFYVFIYIHDLNNCKCVVAFVHVSPSEEVRMKWQMFISHSTPTAVVDVEAEAAAAADGGVLIHRASWIDKTDNAKLLYDTAAATLGWVTLQPEQEKPIMKYNLCMPEVPYKRAILASVVSLPRMGTYESWQQLNYQGAFPMNSPAGQIIRDKFTDVADNAWLGSLYGPTLERYNFTLNERMAQLLQEKGKFTLFNVEDGVCTFTLRNDPHAPVLIDNNVHRMTHSLWGTIDKAIQPADQSREVRHGLVHLVVGPDPNLDPLKGWTTPIPEVQVPHSPRLSGRELQITDVNSPSSSRMSAAESASLSNYQASELSVRFRPSTRQIRRVEPYPNAQVPDAAAQQRCNAPEFAEQNGWGGPARPAEEWGNGAANPAIVDPPPPQRRGSRVQPPYEGNPRFLTLREIQTVLAGGTNPGLSPYEELIAPVPPSAVTQESQIGLYNLLRIDQFSLIQQKQQREICWLMNRMTSAGFGRPGYQTNPGTRPEATEAMPDNVNWATQNANPLPIRPLRDTRGGRGGRGRGSNYGRPAGNSDVSSRRSTTPGYNEALQNDADFPM